LTQGQILEVRIDGSGGEVEELLFTLLAQERPAKLKTSAPEHHVNLLFDDGQLGRAYVFKGDGFALWWVLIAQPDAVTELDADALLKQQALAWELPAVQTQALEWGASGDIAVIAGAADGSQWAVGDATDEMLWGDAVEVKGNVYSWDPTGAVEAWAPNRVLVGSWSGHYMRGMDRVTVRLQFDKTGRVRVERRTGYGQSVEEGTWGVQGGRFRIEPYGGRPWATKFELSGDQLRFTIDGKRATLMRKR
jgi:hypothetical protein